MSDPDLRHARIRITLTPPRTVDGFDACDVSATHNGHPAQWLVWLEDSRIYGEF